MRVAILLAAACGVCAQSALDRPCLGQMLDRQNALRPVYGVGGSFHVDAPIAERVIASACAGSRCVAKTNSAVITWNSAASHVTPAPAGGAIIAVDASGATIYFPSVQQFGRWQNGQLKTLSLAVDGTVLSLNSSSTRLTIAVERSGMVWIVAADGTILDSLPLGTGVVLLTPNGIVYATATSLILRKPDGSELSFPVQGVEDLFTLGDGYVEARAGGVIYALRTLAGHQQLFQLPQPMSSERER